MSAFSIHFFYYFYPHLYSSLRIWFFIVVQKGVGNEEDSEEEFTNQFNPQAPKPNENTSHQEPLNHDQPLPSETETDPSSQLLIDLSDEQQLPPLLDHEDSSSSSSQDIMKLDLPQSKENLASGNNIDWSK